MLPAIDALIVATAICHGLTVVTRNIEDGTKRQAFWQSLGRGIGVRTAQLMNYVRIFSAKPRKQQRPRRPQRAAEKYIVLLTKFNDKHLSCIHLK